MVCADHWRVRMPSESSEQQFLVKKMRRAGIRFCAVPNGGRREKREAARLIKEGVEAGVPDLLIFDSPPVATEDLSGEELGVYEDMAALSPHSRYRVACALGMAPGVGLEMKRAGGTGVEGASAKQLEWGAALRERGWWWMVGHGWRDAISKLQGLGYAL